MYKYSPIKSMRVKNFRNIGDVTLEFDESPIISLIGDNESGKTSLVKAFAVCALHAYTRDQKGFIRDGTNGFGVEIELEDGTVITRVKAPELNKYRVEKPNGEVYDTNKIDSGLPVQVQEVMGLIEEPETKEYLQVRTYEDQLLFVTTAASANYKVMYDALKVDQLTRAIKIGSQEVNELRSEIGENEVSIRTLTENLRGIQIHDLEPLINIRNRLSEQLKVIETLERAKEVADRIETARDRLGALELINKHNLEEIDIVEANMLVTANRLLDNNNKLIKSLEINKLVDTVESIDIDLVTKLEGVIEKRNRLHDRIDRAGALVEVAKLEEIDSFGAQQLNRAIDIRNRLEREKKLLSIIDKPGCNLIEQRDFDNVYKLAKMMQAVERNKLLAAEVEKSLGYVRQVEEYLKQCGAAVIVCDNCGEQNVVDTDELIGNR